MDKQRFIEFRADLAKLRDSIKEKSTSAQYVDDIFSELVRNYPELATNPEELPNLKVECASSQGEKKSDDQIKEKLLRSISTTRFTDYTDINVVLDNEDTC